MSRVKFVGCLAWLAVACAEPSTAPPRSYELGQFPHSRDIGAVQVPGELQVQGDASYRLLGAGADIWSEQDAFHFAYAPTQGDVTIEASVSLPGETGEPYRKAVVMVRDGEQADAAYVDVAMHEGGSAALQYRPYAGAPTLQLVFETRAPNGLRLQRRGDEFTGAVRDATTLQWESVGPLPVVLPAAVQVGMGMCSHAAGMLSEALFSDVELAVPHQLP